MGNEPKNLSDLRQFAKRATGDTTLIVQDGGGNSFTVDKFSLVREEDGTKLILVVG